MRGLIRGAVGLAAVGMLVQMAVPSQAQRAERELLGIRIWRDFKAVLDKHGQPTRIEIGAVTAPTVAPGVGASATAGSGGLPGFPGMGPMGGAMGGAMSGRMRNMPTSAMMGPMMGGPGGMSAMMGGGRGPTGALSPGGGGGVSGGPPSGYASMMQRMMSGGMMGGRGPTGGLAPGGGSPFGGSPFGGAAGFGGMRGGMAMGGGSIGGGSGDGSEGEVTWIYEHGSNTNMFLFNKDGRVIQIQSFGYKGGGVTSRGIALGSSLAQVIRTYGWSGKTTKEGDNMTLDYSQKYHVAFQLTDRKDGKGYRVVGITVALTELGDIPGRPLGAPAFGAGAPMGGPGMMGGPMGGGFGGGKAGGEGAD